MSSASPSDVLTVTELSKHFPIEAGLFHRTVGTLKAVDRVSFTVEHGETLGLVGESGCGKSTVARCILRAYDPTGGSVLFRTDSAEVVDLASIPRSKLKPYRSQVQMIFQDPYSSLNPRMTVLDVVGEPLIVHGTPKDEVRDRVRSLLDTVGLPAQSMTRYPHAFSGGQRQRIGIARALALEPSFIVADEAVSALDVSIQAQILNLLRRLQRELGLTYLFISHDLSVIKHISNRVAVMYLGRIVEVGPSRLIFGSPKHPYTEALLSAIPIPNPHHGWEQVKLRGDIANRPERGCLFAPRCAYAKQSCEEEEPPLETVDEADGYRRMVACYRWSELDLKNVEERGET